MMSGSGQGATLQGDPRISALRLKSDIPGFYEHTC
jgi:hypothetical protein